jgi:Flp pilus assembly protein TadG
MLNAGGRPNRERGQVVVLFGLLLPVLFAIGAIVLDVGNWYVHKRHLQTQVDAAVLASAPSFGGCFQNATVANASVANAALAFAGDTLRDPATTNRQLAEPNDVRVALNADRYWRQSDGVSSPTTGYGLDFGANNPAKMPCATSYLDAKATDDSVRPLWGLIPLTPSPKTHAKVEIRQVREESGFLPLAVPEIDPAYVYAIFVDYAKDGTQIPLKVQELEKNPTYVGADLYSVWQTKPNATVPTNESVTIHPDNTYSDGTGVVILVSKSETPPSKSGTLNQVCTPTLLTACYAGTGTGYDGSATGQGLAFIHSFATSNGTAAQPLLRDVNLGGIVCNGGISVGNLSAPYYVNEYSDCTVGVTAKVDFGNFLGDITRRPNQTPPGICATVSGLTWQSTDPATHISTWTGTMSVPEAAGPQGLTLSWSDKPTGTSCSSPTNSGTFGKAAMSYSSDDPAGPVAYMKLTATGPNAGSTACPLGSTVVDGNSVERGNYCYSVAVGLDRPLALKPWNSPDLVIRFASKEARKGGTGTANLNGSLLCDAGRTLVDTFTTGCFTTYAVNYDTWGTTTTPPPTACTPGVKCWKDITCSAYPPSSLPPASTVNNPTPICIAAKNGQVQAFQAGVYNRWEDPANGFGGCTKNNWPTTQAEADIFFAKAATGGLTVEPRYITLVITDNNDFSIANTTKPIKYLPRL